MSALLSHSLMLALGIGIGFMLPWFICERTANGWFIPDERRRRR